MPPASDVGVPTGMTVPYAGLDLEQAVAELSQAGFEAAEVFVGHLGPRVVEAPVLEAHASAARQVVERTGMAVSTLNCIVGFFDPFTSDETFEVTAHGLARHLRLGAAIGSPRVLIWDGELKDPLLLPKAAALLARVIERGRELARLASPPAITVELHPNTFALSHGRHDEVAGALLAVDAGVCLDFCHAAVALGPGFAADLGEQFLRAVRHVHFADSDGVSEQLHFPPGEGKVDIDAALALLQGRALPCAWDLFGWPAPRDATARGMARYRQALAVIASSKPASEDPR